MKPLSKLVLLINWIDYYIPREIMGPVILVFSMENVVDMLFSRYIPGSSEFYGWFTIMLISMVIIGLWGEADDDKEEHHKEMDELKEEIEEGERRKRT